MTEIDNKINKFKYTLINSFNDLDLVNFYSNLADLKIIETTDEIYGKLDYATNSNYDYLKNCIIIKKNKISDKSLYHELFHMASNATTKSDIKDGFYLYQNKRNFGLGINEGYTEYLTRKYFGKFDNEYVYEFEVIIAKYIEDIIGKNKMESYYLRAQLDSLIDDLSLYSDRDRAILFITDIDFVHYFLDQEDMQNDILAAVNRINEFIICCRLSKYNLSYLEKNSLLKVNYNMNFFEKFNMIQDEIFIKDIVSKYNKEKIVK